MKIKRNRHIWLKFTPFSYSFQWLFWWLNIWTLTDDKPKISSLTFSSFWWPAHGTPPLWMPCWLLMKSSCSLLNSPRMFYKYTSHNQFHYKNDELFLFPNISDKSFLCVELTLSLTVSLIFELALLTAEYKNEPKFFAPCVTFVVTIWKMKIHGEKKERETNPSTKRNYFIKY